MPLDCSSINSLYIGEERHPLCHGVPNTVQTKIRFCIFYIKAQKEGGAVSWERRLWDGSNYCHGLPVLAGSTTPPYGTRILQISFIFCLNSSPWHYSADTWLGILPQSVAASVVPGRDSPPASRGSSLGAAVTNLSSHLCPLYKREVRCTQAARTQQL